MVFFRGGQGRRTSVALVLSSTGRFVFRKSTIDGTRSTCGAFWTWGDLVSDPSRPVPTRGWDHRPYSAGSTGVPTTGSPVSSSDPSRVTHQDLAKETLVTTPTTSGVPQSLEPKGGVGTTTLWGGEGVLLTVSSDSALSTETGDESHCPGGGSTGTSLTLVVAPRYGEGRSSVATPEVGRAVRTCFGDPTILSRPPLTREGVVFDGEGK